MSALGPQDRNRVCIAALAGAHGVRGAVRLKLFTQTPEAIAHYSPLYLEHSDIPITLRLTGPIKGGWAARLDGVDNRDQAQALSGKKLYTTREALESAALPDADQEEDSYFLADLAGLSVLSPQVRLWVWCARPMISAAAICWNWPLMPRHQDWGSPFFCPLIADSSPTWIWRPAK
ncbi:hypothetical protein JCM17844_25530 [Iodidimonas gelatinilytica]|uniref:RimM N-terminal domain-containing protein n=1 Tax=Iodidimonas gelatinilytica TaxID=1236966 RepID=A0A5A7MSY2_9PROT|nr:hypothetical protein [Iodidimonas gelatinilytica]GEQ98916.1 hypothetical protein JCM17844_25530 [Iodidimonas gelatinilytica]